MNGGTEARIGLPKASHQGIGLVLCHGGKDSGMAGGLPAETLGWKCLYGCCVSFGGKLWIVAMNKHAGSFFTMEMSLGRPLQVL